MNSSRPFHLAMALLWFVAIEILIRTSEAVLNSTAVITSQFRGLFTSFVRSEYYFFLSTLFLLMIATGALWVIVLLVRAWSTAIKITSALAYFLMREDSDEPSISVQLRKDLVDILFGLGYTRSRIVQL